MSNIEILRSITVKLRLVDELQAELAAANYTVKNPSVDLGRRSVGSHSDPVAAAVFKRDRLRQQYNAALGDLCDCLQAAYTIIWSFPECRDRLVLHMLYVRGLTIGQVADKLGLSYRMTIRIKKQLVEQVNQIELDQ